TAASAAGFDLQSLAMRTEHDPIQLSWKRGEHLKREVKKVSLVEIQNVIHAHLTERGEPASYLHVHAAGLISLTEAFALKDKEQEFDDAMRATQTMIQSALSSDERFVHYSTGESVDTGEWGLQSNVILSEATLAPGASTGENLPHRGRDSSVATLLQNDMDDSLSDRVEVATVTFLQKNPNSIYLEIEDDLYPRFPGLLTPSKAMIYAVLNSYAEKDGAAWKLRPEDVAASRRNELITMNAMIETVGRRLNYTTRQQDKNLLWLEDDKIKYAFYVLASALVGRAILETPFPPEQTIIVLPGGRAALAAYKAQRDPALAARMKNYRVAKYRLLRTLVEVPVLTRETFEEQLASDPVEKAKAQMIMF
ncbi:MAG: hypothetical protein ABI986_03970, partial [Chloroflexota bacterium]